MKTLAKRLRTLLKNKHIVDMVIFGSITKGAVKPRDIDIAVIPGGDIDRMQLKESAEEIAGARVDLQILGIDSYTKAIWLTLIREGYSVKHDSYISDILGIKPVVLYKYSLKSLPVSKKVMFERAIKHFKEAKRLSNRVVLVPTKLSAEFMEFLEGWGIDIDSQEYALLPLVRKQEF